MTREPREYDREYLKPLPGPIRERVGRDTEHGEVSRFLVQLEYYHDGGWQIVIRYDHDPEGPDEMGHDVTEEGLHMDVYRDGEKIDSPFVAPPMSAGIALDFAEDHMMENLERRVERYEEWHDIRRGQ